MGIYIPGVEMPKKDECIIVYYDGQVWSDGKRIAQIGTAVELPAVLCRECRWFYDGLGMKCCTNHKGVVVTDENGFCHHAKRKSEGADNG